MTQILIKTLSGKHITIDLDSVDITVQELKEKINKKEPIPINYIGLIYQCKRLMENELVSSYNIVKDSTIELKVLLKKIDDTSS
jgi:effector-binding domain-containing protein